jgi:hypothetical protein
VELERDPSHVHDVEGAGLSLVDSRGRRSDRAEWGAAAAPAEEFVASANGRRMRRLIAGQSYFGLGAREFHAGAQRMLERVSAQPLGAEQVNLYCISNDFEQDAAESLGLLRLMIAGGLLNPVGSGMYRPTASFHEYARAPLVAPLSRGRARMLVDAVCDLAAQINADWSRNPFEVRMLAASGSYMSRSEQLPELSLWLILRPRRHQHTRRWRSMVSKGDGLRQILAAVTSHSSFIVPRIVGHRSAVSRPFCVVFEAVEAFPEAEVSASQRLREWSASIGELLGADFYGSARGGRGTRNRGGDD